MLDIISMATLIIVFSSFAVFMMLMIIGGNMNKSEEEQRYEDEEQIKYLSEYAEKHIITRACYRTSSCFYERKRLVMIRKKYRIKIKMIKEVVMDHEQESKEKAKEDVKKIIENSTNDNLNKIFNSKPDFIYKVEII